MRAAPTASPDNIELPTLMQSLGKRMRGVLVFSTLAAGLTYLVCSGIAPRYVSEAQLQVVAKGSASPFADGKAEGGPDSVTVRMDKEAVNTHVRAIMSPDLVSRIADQMQLNDKREFNSAHGSPDMVTSVLRQLGLAGPRPGESEHDRVLSTVFRQLEVYAAKETRSIGIRFTSIDPELAAEFANNLGEAYRQMLALQRGAETTEVNKALEPKIAQLTADVAEADAEVERFRGQANIFRGAQNTGLNEQQLGDLTAELSRAKSERGAAEAKARSARDLLKAGSADVLPDVQKSPMMQNILQQRVRLERQISELSATLLPDHPRMRQLNADLAGLKKQVAAEVGKLVDGFEKEAKVAAAREDAIKKNIDEIKSRVVSSGGDEVKLRQLEGIAKTKRGELERLQAQYEASRMRPENTSAGVEAQIVSKARASSVPVFPKKANYAALAFAASFLLGLALALVRSAMSAARPARAAAVPMQAAAAAGAVAVAAKGKPAKAQAAAAKAAPAQPELEPSESLVGEPSLPVDGIARVITALPHQATGFRTIVVSESDAVDPGLEAVEIACGVADAGKGVIVVEWSPSGQSLARELMLNASPGMNELIVGTATFEQVVTRVPDTEVHFIAAGAPVDDLETVLDPDLVNLLLDALDEAYEHIVVVARYGAGRMLFEAILGRFDAGVTVGTGKGRMGQQPEGVFLGFEVTDITLMRHDRSQAAVMQPAPAPVEVQAAAAAKPAARSGLAAGLSAMLPGGGKSADKAAKAAEKAAKAEQPKAAKASKAGKSGKAGAEVPEPPTVPQAAIQRALRSTNKAAAARA